MRFGVSVTSTADGPAWRDKVRRIEDQGFDHVHLPDHVGWFDPFAAAVATAAATARVRVGTLVLNVEFWNPLLLARVAATTQLLTDGRFELGVGAGHAQVEFEQAGLAYPAAGRRVDRLAATMKVLRPLLSGEEVDEPRLGLRRACLGFAATPAIPLLVGGNGDRVLAVAARDADAVGLVGVTSGTGRTHRNLSHWSWTGLADRLAYVRGQARERANALDVNVLLQRVALTGDRVAAARELAERIGVDPTSFLDTPFVALGDADELRAHVRRLEDDGVTSLTVFEHSSDAIATVTS